MFLPAPNPDTFNLFPTADSLIVYAGNTLLKDPDSDISGPTPSYAGPTSVSFKTGWMNSDTAGRLPEHRVAEFQSRFGSRLERGNIPANATVDGSFFFDRAVFKDGTIGGGVATWANGVIFDLIDQVELAAAKLGEWAIQATKAEPVVETRPSAPNIYTLATCNGAIAIGPKKNGGLYADGHLRVLVVEINGVAKLYTAIPPGLDAAADAAKASADAYSKAMAKALAVKASGGTPEWPPLTRPEPTMSDDLSDPLKKLYDEWWERTSAIVRSASTAAGPTEAAAFADYRGGGRSARSRSVEDRTRYRGRV